MLVASLPVRDGSGRCFQFVFLINSMINVQPETGQDSEEVMGDINNYCLNSTHEKDIKIAMTQS